MSEMTVLALSLFLAFGGATTQTSRLGTKYPVLDANLGIGPSLRHVVQGGPRGALDITPSPALGWKVALDDRVLGFVKMRLTSKFFF